MRKSDISEILRLGREPGMLSLAAGVPFPQSYPARKIEEIASKLIKDEPQIIFPYGDPQGTPRCRKATAYRMAHRGVPNLDIKNIVMTSGSTAAMDMITRMLMDPGDTMIIEAPTFMGCLDSIKNWGLNLVEVPIDEDGIRIDILRDTLLRLKKDGIHPKMLYVMSNYHNPAGIMLSQERRRELPGIAEEFGLYIAEDDAYSELLYDKSMDQTPIKAYDTTDCVFYLGSYSKLVAPGFRVGFAVVPDELVATWNICRPMLDVGSPTINQEVIAELHVDNWLDGHIVKLIEKYKSRRDAMISTLEEHMPSECTWTPAHGGFYVWLTMPDSIDIDHLFQTSLKNKVLYFTGKFFYLDYRHHNSVRLCFSLPDEDVIAEGIKRIATSVKQELAR